MSSRPFSLASALFVAASLGYSASDAQASLQLQITSNGYTNTVNADASTPGEIYFRNTSFNHNILSINGIEANSTSPIDGPDVYSQLSISSFSITNRTNVAQSITFTLSDSGFDPDSDVRPLMIYNTASATSSKPGHLSYQTFAFDGTGNFVTSGPEVVATEAVSFDLPFSDARTTTAVFTPANVQFSLTSILTIEIAARATITGFSGLSLVHAPEPGTVVLALSGVPALTLVALRRRRENRAA